jgi:hypothetical protein
MTGNLWNRTRSSLVLSAALLLGMLAGCDGLPEDDPGALEKVTVVAILEAGDSGTQQVRLTRPLPLGDAVEGPASFVAGAGLRLVRPGGESIQLLESLEQAGYLFDRGDFPLAPGDSVRLEVEGNWEGRAFSGEAWTQIASPEGLAWREKPGDRSHGLDADTLMVHDERFEENFANPSAFFVDWWAEAPDGRDYEYQIEFLAVVHDSLSGEWVRTPRERLLWLRDDEEFGWQVGPYPDLRFPPGIYGGRQPVSWGFFVFLDEQDSWIDEQQRRRDLGYYRVTVRRLTPELSRYYYTTHWWIRERDFDPVYFNLQGPNLQGVVGSCARIDFRVAIAGDL